MVVFRLATFPRLDVIGLQCFVIKAPFSHFEVGAISSLGVRALFPRLDVGRLSRLGIMASFLRLDVRGLQGSGFHRVMSLANIRSLFGRRWWCCVGCNLFVFFSYILNKLVSCYDIFIGVLVLCLVGIVSLVCCCVVPPVREAQRFEVGGQSSYCLLIKNIKTKIQVQLPIAPSKKDVKSSKFQYGWKSIISHKRFRSVYISQMDDDFQIDVLDYLL